MGVPLEIAPESTPETTPEQTPELPSELESLAALEYFGLNKTRSEQLWQRWQDLQRGMDYYTRENLEDFGTWVRRYLHHLVEAEDCDTGDPDTDWSDNLRRIGAAEELVVAIGRRGPEYDGVRLTKSAAQWVDQAIEWRWEHLVYMKRMRGA